MNSYMNSMNLYMNSCIWIHMQALLRTPEIICFFHEFIHEFIIFHGIIYMNSGYEIINSYANPSWHPKILVFHEFMPDIMNLGLFFMQEIIFKFISEEYREKDRGKHSDVMEVLIFFSIEFIGAVRGRAVSDRASPSCCCCSRAICPTISWSVWQSYSANTCHLGLITDSVLVARAAPTWIL